MGNSRKIRNYFSAVDMTCDSPMSVLIRFSIPLLIGNLAQQLYNTADSIIVGRYVGDVALAAVGTSGPILNLLIVLFAGISTGANILSARFFGAKDRETLSHAVGSSVFLTIASGLLMMFVGYFAAPWLIAMVTPPPEVASGATVYLQIIFLGIIGCSAYNILSGILRGLGDSITPLIALIIASLMNIGLDILFVGSFNMGVAGVALATIISQGVSAVIEIIRLLLMRDVLTINLKMLKPHKKLTAELFSLGFPAGVAQAVFSMSAIVVQSLTNSMGTTVMATSVAVMRVDGFAMMPNFTFGAAATTYIGQNIGAMKADRIKSGVRDLLKISMSCSAVLVLCLLLFGHNLIALFSETKQVIDLGVRALRWLALGYFGVCITQSLQGVMRGAGETMIIMWISMFTTVVLRMPLAYLLAYLTRSEAWPMGHPDAIFASLLISWTVGAVLNIIVYRSGKWKRRVPAKLRQEL